MAFEAINVDLSKVYTVKPDDFPLGKIHKNQTGKYVFVKYSAGDGTVTGTAGMLCYQIGSASANYAMFVVTCDYDSATIKALLQYPVGILCNTVTDGQYTWAKFEGENGDNDITTDSNVTAGSLLMAGSANGTVINHDAGAKTVIGIAKEDDSSTTLAAAKYSLKIPIPAD